MNRLNPVFTREASCQDCCRCIRQCPVKAITREKGSAKVDPQLCILCGHCVKVCPAEAKTIRSDLDTVRQLLALGQKPVVSLAPSWAAEFPGWTAERWQKEAARLGFAGVSETALGAQVLIRELGQRLQNAPGVHLSTACPSVVSYIRRYRSGLCALMDPLPSPLGLHARGLKNLYGASVPVVFVGPCAAKKQEADLAPHLITAALTFREWEQLLQDPPAEGIIPSHPADHFLPWPAGPGTAFALEGGMKAAFDRQWPQAPWKCLGVSGFEAVRRALDEAPEAHQAALDTGQTVFLELLACEGGCGSGPGAFRSALTPVTSRLRLESRLKPGCPDFPCPDAQVLWTAEPVEEPPVEEKVLKEILRKLGKTAQKEQLNCSGCGYDTCLQFAEAVARGRAETDMCVSFNRKWAQKKLSALVKTMPFALVIVDDELKILEANRAFVSLAGQEAEVIDECHPGLEGLAVADFIPFPQDFRNVLDTGKPRFEGSYLWDQKKLAGWIFPIEEGRAAGGLFQDITEISLQQGRVVEQTRTVIRKNVEIVQKIAFLLGENAADTEAILNSILQTFGDET